MPTAEQSTPQSTATVTRLIDTKSLLQVTLYHSWRRGKFSWLEMAFLDCSATNQHRDARRMVVSAELGSCTFVCTHQTEKRQVGAQKGSPITCASCETCPLFGLVESVVERMKKPLFELRPNAPWMANVCMPASSAQYIVRGSKSELGNTRGRTGASQRLLLRATIISAKGASETIQLFEPICTLRCVMGKARVCQDPDNSRQVA